MGLFLAALLVGAGVLVFSTAAPRVMVHPNSPSRAGLFPRRMHVEEASKQVVQFYGAFLVLVGVGIGAISLYSPRK